MKNRREILTLGGGLALLGISPVLASSAPTKPTVSESDFVASAQITSTITYNLRAVGIMQIDVGIYTKDTKLKKLLALSMPPLRSAWRAALQDYVNRFYSPGTVPDVVILQRLLQEAADRVTSPRQGQVLLQLVIAR